MARDSARGRTPETREVRATNRRARHDYVISESFEVGLVLLGSEVKSLRLNTPTLREGYARIKNGEVWLEGVHIPPLPQASYFNHEATRPRKCLLKNREIKKLQHLIGAKGMTLVPLSLYFKGPKVKLELGLARGRTKGDRRQREREKEDKKQMRRLEQQ